MRPSASRLVDDSGREYFDEHGWLVCRSALGLEAAELVRWVGEVAAWDDGGPGLHHRELTDEGPRLCRSEDFVSHHAELRALLISGALCEAATDLLGEPAVLYKEKINYKLAGGAGYTPHQDAPAYPFLVSHVSCMVAVDQATRENGCLEVASGWHGELLEQDVRGCIAPDVAATIVFEPVELAPGDVVWFHSRTPHRSGPNRTPRDRRALLPTYNAVSQGDLREAYYEEKRRQFSESDAEDERVRVSLIGDFEGRPA